MIEEKQEERKDFYIYMYLDQENVPFYIGKGSGSRYLVIHHLNGDSRNQFLKNKILKIGIENITIHKLHKNITEQESFYWEKYWIKYIGRRNTKEGTLCNLTDGGEGASGKLVSEETRAKISKIHKGKKIPLEVVEQQANSLKEYFKTHDNAFKGKSHTEKTRQKQSESANKRWEREGEMPQETKDKLSVAGKGKPAWNKGHKLSEKEIQKIKNGMTDEVKQGLREQALGRKHTSETCQKISESLKGSPAWNKGIPAWNRGISPSATQNAKTSEGQREYQQKRREEKLKPLIPQVFKLHQEGMTIKKIATQLGICHGVVSKILNGEYN